MEVLALDSAQKSQRERERARPRRAEERAASGEIAARKIYIRGQRPRWRRYIYAVFGAAAQDPRNLDMGAARTTGLES